MKRILSILVVACFSFTVPAARAQLGLYAGFSASHTNISNAGWFYGSTFGAYYTPIHLPVVNVGLDGRGAILRGSGGSGEQAIYNFLAGPQAVLHLPLLPFRPYAEALIGGSHTDFGQGSAYQQQTSFSYGFAAGADVHLLPRLDWRLLEYAYTRSPSIAGGTDESTFTTGIVFRVPVL